MTASPARASLIGRDEELAALSALLRSDGGGSLLLAGRPGTGKSALLDAAAHTARHESRAVVRAAGVPSETRVPFAALHQLLYPLAGSLKLLAPRYRDALLGAFGHTGAAPEMFLAAIATLELLGAAAAGTGLLVVVDDLQWVDDVTARVLGFVARRITSEPVVLLAATRPGFGNPLIEAAVPVRVLRPLGGAEAAQLLRSRHPDLDRRQRSWVLEYAEGNPLALAELPLTAAAGQPGADGLIPLTARLERSFAARVADLSSPARSAVVVAAADDSDDFAEIAAAVRQAVPETGTDALRPAVDAGVLVVSRATVAFEHRLTRSAIYQSAQPDMRRRAHAALSEVLAAQPGRRAWHQAAAALAPDESIAADLEAAARHGAGPACVTAWERAACLSPRADHRARRFLHAAALSLDLGRPERAAELASQAEPLVDSPAGRARLALIRDALHPGISGDPVRVAALTDLAIEMIESGDSHLAFRLLLAAALHVWSADPGPEARARLMAAAGRLPVPADDPHLLSIGGLADPARYADLIMRRAAALRPGQLDPAAAELVTSVHLIGAGEPVIAVQRAVLDEARRDGRLAALPRLLTQQLWNAVALADCDVAVPTADEAVRLAAETRQPLWQSSAMTGQAMIAGMRGDDGAAAALTFRAEAMALPARVSAVLCSIQFTRGVTAIGAGQYDEAFDHLSRVFDTADPCYQAVQCTWALGDLAEPATHTGRTAEAREIAEAFRPGTNDSMTPWTRVALIYAAPLLASEVNAEREFRRALGTSLVRWPFYRARLLIEYGSWLRRRRRAAEARAPLRTALQICAAHGLLPWSERARQELRAAGGASTETPAQQPAGLSPQELQIARLAAGGMSNREIAQRLFISHRTVGSHLYKIFPKLGVSSRAQLRFVLAPASPAADAR